MRVLMVSWEYPPLLVGGLGRHVHALAEQLAAGGHEVTVLTRGGAPSLALPADEVTRGVRVLRVADEPAQPGFEDDLLGWVAVLDKSLARAGRALRERPDVVHAHDWLGGRAAAALVAHYGAPLVATLHATEAGRHQGWLPEPLNRAIHAEEWRLASGADRVITCSAAMRGEATRLFDLPDGIVEVVPNGVDPERWRPTPQAVAAARRRWAPDGPLVLYYGRLVHEKGVHDLLAAVARLRRRYPGIRVVVAGTGPKATELRELARRLRLGRSVAFGGFVPDAEIAALAAAADCAVVPSVYEPFGLVALEAAAAGTPVVVSDVGGLREFVADGRTGLRFPAGDPAGLADAVGRLLADPGLGRRLVAEARLVLDRDHAWSRVAERTVEVYRRAAAERRIPASPGAAVPGPREGNLLTGAP